jgi:hypothetical protein
MGYGSELLRPVDRVKLIRALGGSPGRSTDLGIVSAAYPGDTLQVMAQEAA